MFCKFGAFKWVDKTHFFYLWGLTKECFMSYKNSHNLKNIRTLIQPIFDRMDVFLVNLELRGAVNNQVLSVFADTEEGITLEQITDLTVR